MKTYVRLKLVVAILTLLLNNTIVLAQNNRVMKSDINKIVGFWKGKLTYKDYTSGKPFTMDTNLNISKNKNDLILSYLYPKEPNANSIDTLKISKDRQLINNLSIVSKNKKENGDIEIVTQELSIDGNENKEALIKHYIIFNKRKLILKKEIKFLGEENWITRYEYVFDKEEIR